MDYLISKNILKQKNGNYKDYAGDKQIVVTGRYGSGKFKQRFLPDPTYNYLLKLQKEDKQKLESIDIDKIKHNQRYMFNSSG